MEQAGKQQETKYTLTSSDAVELQEFDHKRTLFETMTKTKSFNKNTNHKALYRTLVESILEDEDDKGVADKSKNKSHMMLTEMKALINVDHSSAICAAIKSEVLTVVKEYLGTSLDDVLHKKSAANIRKIKMEQAGKQQETKYTLTSSDAVELQEFDHKRTLFETMTKTKDEGPHVRSNQGLKRKKTSKDVEPSKKAKSTKTSKGTTKSQPKSTAKSAQVEETVFEARDTQVPQNLVEDMRNNDEPPIVNADLKDWFKKPERPPTPKPEWNKCKTTDNKTTQKWLSDLAKA
nr:hypothetical protein [Tanacetum cinerariifolium]